LSVGRLLRRLGQSLVFAAAAASFALPAATVSSAQDDKVEVMGLEFELDVVSDPACEFPSLCAPDYLQNSANETAVSATGLQLAAHRLDGAEPDLGWAVEQAGDAPALVGLVAALLGCALALTRPRARRTLLLIATIGVVATGLLPVALRYLPLDYYAEPPSIEVGAGYVLAVSLFAAAIVIQALNRARPGIAAPATKPQL
jgi:hypothetical protein